MLLIGIDDAGRGPILGPMFLAGVLIKAEDEKVLKNLGAKDSKLLSHPERIKIASEIVKTVIAKHVAESSPEQIDRAVEGGENLNTLEAKKAADIINALNTTKEKIKVIIDCPSVNLLAWKKTVEKFILHKENLDIHCEHKADFNHPVVSAASILAKVAREEAVASLKKRFGDIGSGYPADPQTQEFFKTKGIEFADSGIVRTSWATWKTLFPEYVSPYVIPKEKKKSKQKKLF